MFNASQFHNSMENFRKETDKALRSLFSGKIMGTFLIEMKYKVLEILGNEIYNYYNFQVSEKEMVTMDLDMPDFDICRHIVGLHRSNLIFATENERLEKEKSAEYKLSLAKKVIENIKLRNYGSIYFRKQAIMRGDNFIYFHLPYDLFVISMRINELLSSYKYADLLHHFGSAITNKSIATLTLLEDGFLDCAYPLCRGIIELYLKFLLLLQCPYASENYLKFSKFELDKSCIRQTYPQNFNELFDNRLNQGFKNKAEFLHYGWVDCISDYHLGKLRPYSISGIISYLKNKYDKEQSQFFDNLETLYKMCHGYTHGNACISKYPLLHYFEISIMLFYTVSHTYKILCEQLQVSETINDVDIISRLENDFSQVELQYSNRSTENFEMYYKSQF